MRNVTMASSSSRFTPPAPTFDSSSNLGNGQFQIINYTPAYTYTLSVASGSGSLSLNTSNGVISGAGVDCRISVTARSAKGVTESTPGYVERKQYTYTDNPYQCNYHCWFTCCQQPWCDPPGCCGCGSGCCDQTCGYDTCHNYVKNATPGGYTDNGSEWWKAA